MGVSQETRDSIIADPNIALSVLNCAGLLMQVCWILGYPDQARLLAEHLAELLKHSLPANAYSLGIHHLLTLRRDFLREYEGVRVQAQETFDRSTRTGSLWGIVFGTIELGRAMVADGEVDAAIAKLAAAIDTTEAGYDRAADWLIAGGYLEARRVFEGSPFVEQALARAAQSGSRRFEADLYRIKGEFILIAGGALSEAEAAFNSAIGIARRQQAKSFELRASLSLARLLAQQGMRDEARSMLAEIYNWFTEGFDTADLKEAASLLAELGGN
jgi:tetratricopeptide (TPR) repeat protein